MKVKSSKGFTLAELLIVMAIIVVLAAVAIPTFGRQLETARETGDMENIRNAYTEALSVAILDAADGKLDGFKKDGSTAWTITNLTINAKTSGTTPDGKNAVYAMTIEGIKNTPGWDYVNNTVANKAVGAPAAKGNTFVNFYFQLDNDGNLSLGALGTAGTSDITVTDTAASAPA